MPNAEPANTNPMPSAPPSQEPSTAQEPTPVQAPVQTPAQGPDQNPVTPPAQEPAPTGVPPEGDTGTVPAEPSVEPAPAEYTPTGNKALDAAAKLVSAQGFNPTELSKELSEHGDFTDQTRKSLTEKFGEEQVDILAATYTSEVSKMKSTQAEAVSLVHNAVGGQETWDKIAAWTATEEAGLSDEAANSYNQMLNAGGVQAELAARALKEAYMASPGFKQENPNMQQPDTSVPPAPAVEAISRPQYTKERKKAVREGNAALVEQLDARARHTMDNLPSQWRINAVIN